MPKIKITNFFFLINKNKNKQKGLIYKLFFDLLIFKNYLYQTQSTTLRITQKNLFTDTLDLLYLFQLIGSEKLVFIYKKVNTAANGQISSINSG